MGTAMGALPSPRRPSTVALRRDAVRAPILVLGVLSRAELQPAVRARADVVVWRESFLSALAELRGGEGTGVHIKLDSGMGRLGQSGRRVDAVQEKARVRVFQWRRP